MAKKLVIVESPAKAKTIGSYLGPDYEVQASIGHIRDLLPNSKGLPPELKKKWWADYSVDVDNGFEPIYEVPEEKSGQVAKLRSAMKGIDTLVLATDEDREGESISWHLLQVLKPPKSVKVERIAFHEITKDAILRALQNPRKLDEKLVEAQEARRILDRLYGYTLSPVLWSRVTKNLSAGRVQSPAVKIIVDREEARRRFIASVYWDLRATVSSKGSPFTCDLREVDGRRVAAGRDFDPDTGKLIDSAKAPLVLGEAEAGALALKAKDAKPWIVESIQTKETTERPAPPFMTTTMAQEANRRFGYSADRTMRIAQQLYEGITIQGEQIGLITYMRTDSLTLSSEAIAAIRGFISKEYPDCLPSKAESYQSKVRNAQEAHEAIRPTHVERTPDSIRRYLSDDQAKLYELIWKRAVASQMKHAKLLRTEVAIGVQAEDRKLTFQTSGKQVLFDGFLRLYSTATDDEDQGEDKRLPNLKEGQVVDLVGLDPLRHETKPPARYTDATLIKKLEEMGIGRPSTYATIISTIIDRGYVRKNGKQLVPTFKAYLTMEVLEKNFEEFMELGFTAKMDDCLDEIANGELDSKHFLSDFFVGSEHRPGLKSIVEQRKKEIPYPAFVVGLEPETAEPILVRTGKTGDAFLQLGPAENKRFANVPEELAPADLTLAKAIELLNNKAVTESIGFDPVTGRRLLLKNRQGYYLEVERTQEEIERKDKPRWISLPPGIDPRSLTQEDLDYLVGLPKTIGANPETREPITFRIGKFGPYLECGSERRTVEDWRLGQTATVETAMTILAQPKTFGRQAARAAGPIQEFGVLEGAAGPVKVLSGRFGPYVTDGEVNATLPKGKDPASLSKEDALELLRKKREAGPSPKRKAFKRTGKRKKSA